MFTKDILLDIQKKNTKPSSIKNMKPISINFILHDRLNYFRSTVKELFNIKPELKSLIRLNLLISHYSDDFSSLVEQIKSNNLEVHVFHVKGSNNYLTKIQTAIDNSIEYAISIDEDIYITSNVWEYFLFSLNILNNTDILFLAPIISTGIPSVDLFAEQFLSEEERKKLNSFYNKTTIPNIWGANYMSLNEFTIKAYDWNYDKFYNEVNKIDHHYRGVHPVRFSYDAQNYLNDLCINNLDRISRITEFSIRVLERPYFCNSVFGIKVNTWKEIINSSELYRDEFDEVPLNLYMRNKDMKMAFINNGFAIHPSYNTINIYGHNYTTLSDRFFTSIK